MTRTTTTPDPAADNAAAQAGDVVDEAAAAAPWTASPGDLVQDENGRYGLVVHPGRTPGVVFDAERAREIEESPEPLVLWFSGIPAPYGLPLTPV